MKYLKKINILKESPDTLILPNGEKISWMNGIAFGYYNDNLELDWRTHGDMLIRYGKSPFSRELIKYSGRIFVKQQIITFWEFPEPENFKKLIKDIEDRLEININNDWQVEILLDNGNISKVIRDDWKKISPENVKFIKISEYEKYWGGIKQRTEDELKMVHLATPAEKQELKKKGWGKGFGSDKLSPLSWRQAKYVENKLYESPNDIYVNGSNISMCGHGYDKNREVIHRNVKDEITFIYANKNLYYTIGCDSHYSIAMNNDLSTDRDAYISGRVFSDYKIITFWKFPKDYEELMVIVDEISKKTGEKFDEEWKIEVPKKERKINTELSEFEYNFIPLNKYKGVAKHSEEEMGKAHLDWRLKQKMKEKGFGKGFGSDMSKGLAWKQARYVENFNNFLLFESRKEDVLQKFIKEFGNGLGPRLYDADKTENKAYIEWLLAFCKRNEKELGIDKIKEFKKDKTDINEYLQKTKKVQNLLSSMINKYHNNKKDYNAEITQIKTLDELREVLDKKDNFDTIENYNKKDVKVWLNNLEWLVFQPYSFHISELANRKKDRTTNWCTTHNKGEFENHGGEKGGLLYCINKLEPEKDVAFELLPNENVISWDYKDVNSATDLFNMKNFFDENSEIYKLFDDEIEHNIEIPEYTSQELEDKAFHYYSDLGIEELGVDSDAIFDTLDRCDFVENFLNNEVEYYANSIEDLIQSHDSEFEKTIEWLKDEIGLEKLLDFYDCPEEELDDAIKDSERVVDDLLKKYNKNYEFAKYFILDHYQGYDARGIYDDFYGNSDNADPKELIKFAGDDFDEDQYKDTKIRNIVKEMTDEEIMELIWNV